jgi:hypothetical protein
MLSTFKQVRKACRGRRFTDRPAKLERAHANLKARAIARLDRPRPGDFGAPGRVRDLALTLRQVFLHRATLLFEATLDALVAGNAYAMILAMRAGFETTAALGHLHRKLSSARDGNISLADVDKEMAKQVLGSRHESLPSAMPAISVMTLLDSADRAVRDTIGTVSPAILRDCYEFLCEFAHPNFHSNKTAFDLEPDKAGMAFRHGKGMNDDEFGTLGYALMWSDIYIHLHDAIDGVLPPEVEDATSP